MICRSQFVVSGRSLRPAKSAVFDTICRPQAWRQSVISQLRHSPMSRSYRSQIIIAGLRVHLITGIPKLIPKLFAAYMMFIACDQGGPMAWAYGKGLYMARVRAQAEGGAGNHEHAVYDFEVVHYVVGGVQEEARHHAVELAGHVGASVHLAAPTPVMLSAEQLLLPTAHSSWLPADIEFCCCSCRKFDRRSAMVGLQDAGLRCGLSHPHHST